MTIAICLKVGDGVVLGTDSASSLIGDNERYFNVYSSAEKTTNLVKGLPIGMMSYGLGGLLGRSIGSLARDLRHRLQGDDPGFKGWWLDPESYTIGEVARRVKGFFYDELYRKEFGPPALPGDDGGDGAGGSDQAPGAAVPRFPSLGFIVAGYSASEAYPEVWEIEVGSDGRCAEPQRLYNANRAGVVDFWGISEALNRLVYGWSAEAHERMMASGLESGAATDLLVSYADLAHPAMPMQDAIDLVRYLADVTVGYVRFKAGAPTVAGPIDIAAITRHQGFKWVTRKQYYSAELNRVSMEERSPTVERR